MTMATKNEIFKRFLEEYLKADKQRKGEILDNICDTTKMNRKSAIRRFGVLQLQDPNRKETRGRPRYYTPEVIFALNNIWKVGNEMCGELLFPMAREYVETLMRDEMWKHSNEATDKLLVMSMGTMKNKVGEFLKIQRKGRGFSLTSPSNLKHIIPVFTGPWKNELPGSGQIDTVAHCGSTLLGDFAYTLNYVDISTLWDIVRAQWNKGQEATINSLKYIKNKLPFLLQKIHPDTGSEFINWLCKKYCDTNKIEMTRSRPNHKNDNAHIEERNGHVVRKYVGYMRYDCKEAVDALNNLYAVLCPYLNHFIPSRKCIEKKKIGSKYVKRYEKIAKTPYQRVLENKHIPEETKEKLRQEHSKLNPLIMKKEIERLRSILYDVQKKHDSQKQNSQNRLR